MWLRYGIDMGNDHRQDGMHRQDRLTDWPHDENSERCYKIWIQSGMSWLIKDL